MTFLPSQFTFNELPGNTIVPDLDDEQVFIQYLTRIYEDIAFAVNNKDNVAFVIPITDTATDIPNVANFGSFLICVSGVEDTLPCGVWALCKSNEGINGTGLVPLTFQAGTGDWLASTLTISNGLVVNGVNSFQIRHNNAGFIGNFSIRIVSTI